MIQIPSADIYLAFMAIARISALFFMLPIFSSSTLPMPAKVGLIGIFSILLVPLIANVPAMPTHLLGLVIALTGEIIIGLLMGFAARLLFFAIQFATEIMAIESALMRSQSFDPSTEVQGSVLTPLYFFLATTVFVVTGTHLEVLAAFVRSYDYVPAGLGVFSLGGVEHITRSISAVFELGLRMAAPLVAMAFIINLIFAILGKVAAKVQVMIVSFGIRILLSLMLMAMSVPLMLRYILNGLDGMGLRMLEFIVAQ